MSNAVGGTGTQILLEAGGATGGGAAIGGVAGGIGWAAARDVRRAWAWLMRRDPVETPLASFETFVAIGGFLGGFVGLLIWLYEHFELV